MGVGAQEDKMSRILKAFLENEKAIRHFLSRFSSSKQDIEDFTQETFLRGFAAEMRRDIQSPKAFLFQIARNTALEDIRKKKKNITLLVEDSGGADIIIDESQPLADEWLDGRRKLALFSRAVAELPPQCRRAFLLRHAEGLQYKKIANRMGISISAVEKHVALGLVKCNAYLREQGYEPSEFGAVEKVKVPGDGMVKQKTTARSDEQND